MPRRAAPGDRAAIEAALTDGQRATLGELVELFDAWDWTRTPLYPPFAFAAVIQLAAAVVAETGASPTAALQAACAELDIPTQTVRTWSRRIPADSRVQVERRQKPVTEVSLIRDAVITLTGTAA